MIGRRCNAGNGISRPVLIARNLSVKPFLCSPSVSQVIYCGGFSSVDPPLSIPNREVKRTYADGTDRPVGRVGSRRSSDPRTKQFARGSFFVPFRPGAQRRCAAPPGSRPPRLFPSAPRVFFAAAFSLRDGERAGPCRQENGVPVPAFPVRQALARRGAPSSAPGHPGGCQSFRQGLCP